MAKISIPFTTVRIFTGDSDKSKEPRQDAGRGGIVEIWYKREKVFRLATWEVQIGRLRVEWEVLPC
jgi:hypothetical protein